MSQAKEHAPRWHATVVVVGLLAFQLLLPGEVSLGPSWLVPAIQAAVLVPQVVANPVRIENTHPVLRILALSMAALVLVANLARLLHLVYLIADGEQFAARDLVLAAIVILVTNVVAVALVFWELDRGGPVARDPLHRGHDEDDPDLLFPQMTLDDPVSKAWRPEFVDYLFVAFTATTAFSPTDVMPLSRSFKLLFMLASTTALATIAVVGARAVNLV